MMRRALKWQWKFLDTHLSSRLAILTVALSLLATATVAQAITLTCGQTVGPGATVVVDADTASCAGAGTPALTVVGPVTLDMGGHQLRCTAINPADGIRVIGDRARILNGSVRACGYGVRVEGAGRHTLSGVNANTNNGIGIELLSERNTVTHCSATSNSGAGFRIASTKNRVDRCVANNNAAGIVVEGEANKLVHSQAIANATTGIDVSGNGNQISRNAVASNDQSGFQIGGEENKIRENHSARNTQRGFGVTGDNNSLSDNTATRNASSGFVLAATVANRVNDNLGISNAGHGIDVSGENNEVTRGHFVNNGLSGIEFSDDGPMETSGVGNVFEANVAMENTNADVRDTTACTGATWEDNSFSTSNDPCIQ